MHQPWALEEILLPTLSCPVGSSAQWVYAIDVPSGKWGHDSMPCWLLPASSEWRHSECFCVLCKSKTQCKPHRLCKLEKCPFSQQLFSNYSHKKDFIVMFHIFIAVDGLLIVALSLCTERLFILRFLGLNCYLFCLVPVRYKLVISTQHICLGPTAYCLPWALFGLAPAWISPSVSDVYIVKDTIGTEDMATCREGTFFHSSASNKVWACNKHSPKLHLSLLTAGPARWQESLIAGAPGCSLLGMLLAGTKAQSRETHLCLVFEKRDTHKWPSK